MAPPKPLVAPDAVLPTNELPVMETLVIEEPASAMAPPEPVVELFVKVLFCTVRVPP